MQEYLLKIASQRFRLLRASKRVMASGLLEAEDDVHSMLYEYRRDTTAAAEWDTWSISRRTADGLGWAVEAHGTWSDLV